MKSVFVLGSFVVDLMGRADHLPKPGETVKGSFFQSGPGGKGANQAVAAKRMGADVRIATKVGKDDFGDMAVRNFEREGFDTGLIFRDDTAATGTALILVDENTSQNSILVTLGACETFNSKDMAAVKSGIDRAAIFLTQLETNVDVVAEAIGYAAERGKTVILNPAPVQPIAEEIYSSVDVFTPNEVEAGILAGLDVCDRLSAAKAADFFLAKGVGNVVITMGGAGVFLKNARTERFFESFRVKAIDTTGAGDAFNGGLAAALAEGQTLDQAVLHASAVGALSVTRMGTAPAMPYKDDVGEFLRVQQIKGGVSSC